MHNFGRGIRICHPSLSIPQPNCFFLKGGGALGVFFKNWHIFTYMCPNGSRDGAINRYYSAKASLGYRRQPRRVRSCFESAPMTDPPSYEDSENSTPPFKFRQDQSGEVRSRWVELSVERANASFLSVSQRSTS